MKKKKNNTSSASPALSLGLTIFLVRFLCMFFFFFNPMIEVITCLCGWCMLGVFLLPAFTHLEHECRDLLSLCDGMHVYRLDFALCSHQEGFLGNGVRIHVNSKRKIPCTGGSEEGQTCDATSCRT